MFVANTTPTLFKRCKFSFITGKGSVARKKSNVVQLVALHGGTNISKWLNLQKLEENW